MSTETASYIERDCTVAFEGKTFEAGGAIVTDKRIVAYPADNGVLNDWHGKPIGKWYEISSRPAVFFGHRSFMADRYYYMRAVVNGVQYSLRGFGVGMVAMGKRVKG